MGTNLKIGLTVSHRVDQLLDNMGHFIVFVQEPMDVLVGHLWGNCAHVTIFMGLV